MIYITGDTHSDVRKLKGKEFEPGVPLTSDDIVIICGDFGLVWSTRESKQEKYWLDWLESKEITVCFVDGNHENFQRLYNYPVEEWMGGKVHFIRKNVIHLMRGQIFTIEGNTFFTMGGASCHDIQGGILEPNDPQLRQKMRKLDEFGLPYRINLLDWWKEELPSVDELEEGIENLEKVNWQVDYIISHCAPLSIQLQLVGKSRGEDRLVKYFEGLQKKCTFKKWFFGHYHIERYIDGGYVALYNQILPLSQGDNEDWYKKNDMLENN